MNTSKSAVVPPTGVLHRRSIRRTTYGYYGKLTMVEPPGDPYLPQVTSPVGGSGARDSRKEEECS